MRLYHNITVYNSHSLEERFSQLTQTADEISSVVSRKVGYSEVISSINQSAESVTIKASRISLEGLVTANERFKIKLDGSIEATNAIIFGEITSSVGDMKTKVSGGQIDFFKSLDGQSYTLSGTIRPYKDGSKVGMEMVSIGNMLAFSYDLINPNTGVLEWMTPLYINKDMNPTVGGKTYKQHVLMMDHARVCNSHLIVDKDLVLFDTSGNPWKLKVTTSGTLSISAATPSDYGGL